MSTSTSSSQSVSIQVDPERVRAEYERVKILRRRLSVLLRASYQNKALPRDDIESLEAAVDECADVEVFIAEQNQIIRFMSAEPPVQRRTLIQQAAAAKSNDEPTVIKTKQDSRKRVRIATRPVDKGYCPCHCTLCSSEDSPLHCGKCIDIQAHDTAEKDRRERADNRNKIMSHEDHTGEKVSPVDPEFEDEDIPIANRTTIFQPKKFTRMVGKRRRPNISRNTHCGKCGDPLRPLTGGCTDDHCILHDEEGGMIVDPKGSTARRGY